MTTLKWLWHATKKTRYLVVLLFVIETTLAASGVIAAWTLRALIDEAVERHPDKLLFYCICIVGIFSGQILISSIGRYLYEQTRAQSENTLKLRLFQKLLQKDYSSVTAKHSGDWMTRLTSDVSIVANACTEMLPSLGGMLAQMIGAMYLLVVLIPQTLWVVLPGGACVILITYAIRKKLKKMHKNIQEADGRLRTFLQEHISALLILHAFSREMEAVDQAEKNMDVYKAARLKRMRFSTICTMGYSVVMRGAFLASVIYCAYGIMAGRLTYGTFVAVIELVGQVQGPFSNLSGFVPRYYSMTASAERLIEAERYEEDISEPVVPAAEVETFYKKDFLGIELKDVCFSYPAREGEACTETSLVQNLNFGIRKGEFVALKGPSGCGKSTLLKLMMCLYQINNGNRLLNAHSREQELTASWRGLFAYVPQGNQLMAGTIRDIVTFDQNHSDNDAIIWKALTVACADCFVEELPNKLDTVLGEHGVGLSEGQMQRIAIARAVYSQRPILLLDEATSALDEQTEKKLLDNLRSMTDRTVIIVTHRPAAFEVCDRIREMSDYSNDKMI